IPKPVAAPAKLVISPVRTHRDAEREKNPCDQNPGPHPARPCGVHPALDQCSRSKSKRNRESDIAEVKKRRMNREADILQNRIELLAFGRRRIEAQKRIR